MENSTQLASGGGGVPPPARPKKRTGTSKYDFLKVKVWLGDNLDHYYVLSRFLICRMLTVTKIPYIKAAKIALETKKYLIDNNLHDVTQAELEGVLFSIVRGRGLGEEHIHCYRLVSAFYQARRPLCVLICGTAWTGKSTIAQQLAARVNIPNVMQTDVLYELLCSGEDSPFAREPLWARHGMEDADLVASFRREAVIVRKAMEGDLDKTLCDGKAIIIEGLHLDPGAYIQDFARRGIVMLPATTPCAPAPAAPAASAAATSGVGSAAGRMAGGPPPVQLMQALAVSAAAAGAEEEGEVTWAAQDALPHPAAALQPTLPRGSSGSALSTSPPCSHCGSGSPPCVSQEHSTTEVVTPRPSCSSPPISPSEVVAAGGPDRDSSSRAINRDSSSRDINRDSSSRAINRDSSSRDINRDSSSSKGPGGGGSGVKSTRGGAMRATPGQQARLSATCSRMAHAGCMQQQQPLHALAAGNGAAHSRAPGFAAGSQPLVPPHWPAAVQTAQATASAEPPPPTVASSALSDAGEAGRQVPLFVPVLLYMEQPDHALMQEEALAARDSIGVGGGAMASTSAVPERADALRRARLLQDYLCAYEAQGLPLVRVSYGSFGEALDKLHEYVLQCIKSAMAAP